MDTPHITIQGIEFTFDPAKALTFKDRGEAHRFADLAATLTRPVVVMGDGPIRYPALQSFSLITTQGSIASPAATGKEIVVSKDGEPIWIIHFLGTNDPKPCPCIDCGGTENAHSSDCEYAKELAS